MAKFAADLTDIEFLLFDVLKIQSHQTDIDRESCREIIHEYEKFTRQEIFPTREPSDRDGVKLEGGKVIAPSYMAKLHRAFHENGWYALGVKEQWGGTPVPEALAIAGLSLATGANTGYMMYPGLTKAAMNVIAQKGAAWMQQHIIPKMMGGTWGGSMCLTEPGAGSDVGALRTTATPLANGEYSIKGTKIFISSGEVDFYENTIHLVLAKTPSDRPGTKGISLFVVPRYRIDTATGAMQSQQWNQVRCSKVEEKMGIHSSATCELQFGEQGECRGYLIGDEFEGMSTMFIMMNEARLLCGLQGESQACLTYEMAKQYASERVQFDHTLDQHPDVIRMLHRMRSMSRGLRHLMLFTANAFDQLHRSQEQQSADYEYLQDLVGLLTPICKAYATEQGLQMSLESVQVHGGYGYCTEYGVEQFVRDTLIGRIYEGTNGIQAIDFLTRKVFRQNGQVFARFLQERNGFMEQLAAHYPKEVALYGQVVQSLQQQLKQLGAELAQKQVPKALGKAYDLLFCCSGVVVASLLAESSCVASKAAGYAAPYLAEKQQDAALFIKYHLVNCLAQLKTLELS
jgi:alkylation response protein AidB-like acyl-CoA dehydrogenase